MRDSSTAQKTQTSQISGLTGRLIIVWVAKGNFQSGSSDPASCLSAPTRLLSVCRYDPQTDVWTAVAPMSISRDAVGVCPLGDRLFAVGGYDGQVYLSTVEAYDPQTNEWTQVRTQMQPLKIRFTLFRSFL